VSSFIEIRSSTTEISRHYVSTDNGRTDDPKTRCSSLIVGENKTLYGWYEMNEMK